MHELKGDTGLLVTLKTDTKTMTQGQQVILSGGGRYHMEETVTVQL